MIALARTIGFVYGVTAGIGAMIRSKLAARRVVAEAERITRTATTSGVTR